MESRTALHKKSFQHLLFLGVFIFILSSCSPSQGADLLNSNDSELASSEVKAVDPMQVMSVLSPEEAAKLKEKEEKEIIKSASLILTNTKKVDEKTYNISGETSANCSKIVVNAYDVFKKSFDVYTITNYKYGDKIFNYGISEAWNNLKVGENTYIFRAYCDKDQVVEAITSLTYYGGYENSELDDNLKAIQEELKTIEALKNKLESQQKENLSAGTALPNSAASTQPTVGAHVFSTSSFPNSKLYYCDTDPAKKNIPPVYLKSYPSEAELLKEFPTKTLNLPCQ